MKKAWSKWLVMAAAFFMMSAAVLSESKAQGSVSLQVFYDELQPYGTWRDHSSYGYVWVPRVDRGFTPYATNGYWINTEYGNTWVSDYSWGWAPFHYGRWFYDDFDGWIWVPDTEWAPAWVAWRSGGGYYGWAPLMPGFGMSVSVNYYHRIPHNYWSFVPHRYITYRTVYSHCIPRRQVVNIINHTTIVNNYYTDSRRRTYFTGPTRREIETRNRERVEVYKINDRNRPGRSDIDRGTVSFYKPEIDNSRDSRTRSMPSGFKRDGKVDEFETRRERTSEFPRSERSADVQEPSDINSKGQRSDANQLERRRQLDTENQNRSFQNFEKDRENEQRSFNQKSLPDKQNRNYSPNGSEQRDQNFQRERESINKNNQPQRSYDQPQRNQPMEKQNGSRSQPEQNQRQREQFGGNDFQRTHEQQSQRSQQMERQNSNRPQSQPSQRERSTVRPNSNIERSMGQPQREQQMRRSPSEQRTNQPSRNADVNTPRKRN